MTQLKGSRTEKNLRAALAREAQDSRRFEYFARAAAVEGKVAAARALRQIAEGETAHAFGHLEFLEAIDDPLVAGEADDVRRHLRAAIAAEEEHGERYEARAAVAREERMLDAAAWFALVAHAKRVHAATLRRTVEAAG
ncbi:MAG TPA: ferritin family protein [Candidatus Dormibacteraeota bacterium]|nr:ferritin family protein [Candidatus Dormibacteraeota bacterium]